MYNVLTEFPMIERLFYKRYDTVFDEKGNVKVCGREATSSLIDLCIAIDFASGSDYYGDPESGAMNVEHVKELYTKIKGC